MSSFSGEPQLSLAVLTGGWAMPVIREHSDWMRVLVLVAIGAACVLIRNLPKTITALRIILRHLPVDGSVKAIGIALNEALCRAGWIETSLRRTNVKTVAAGDGSFYVTLVGASFYEASLFADCLAEILGPIDNPRYLIVREGTIFGVKRDDYHSVPLRLAASKENAQIFYQAWTKHVGVTELIYTRSSEGRKTLLKAKAKAFSSAFAREIKRQDRWQGGFL